MGTDGWAIAGVAAILLALNLVRPLWLHRGGESEAFQLDEGAFVVLAALVPPAATVLVFLAANIVGQSVLRRPFVKSAFNIGQTTLAASLGLIVGRAIAVPGHPLQTMELAGVTVGAVVYFAVSHMSVSAVLVSVGSTWRECLLDDLPIQLILGFAGILAGDIVTLAVAPHIWALGLTVPAVVVLRLMVAAHFRARHDRLRLQGLFDVTLDANRRLSSDAVLDAIIASARDLLRCSEVGVASGDPGEGSLAARIDAGVAGGGTRWLVASGRRREDAFDGADRTLLDALAAVGRGALANAELYRQVRLERERLSSITLSIGEGVCAVDLAGRITFANPAAAELVSLPPRAGTVDDNLPPDALQAPDFILRPARAAIDNGVVVREDDAVFPARDGGMVPVAYTASPVFDSGEPVGAVIAFRDITERKAFEDEMSRGAYYDSLTGLGNRRLLVERLEKALIRAGVDGRTHALIFLDVDRFKSINDSLGHVNGDDLLVELARRMRLAVRDRDLLTRFGGDEFVLLVEGVSSADEAMAVAGRVCAAAKAPMVLPDGYEVVASVSAGVALAAPGQDADDLLHDADVAMYEAKSRGSGGVIRLFDVSSMGRRSSERLDLEASLRRAVERDEMDVYFQPVFSVTDECVVGAEALVRWNHPELGLVGPARFISLAEETGLILPIGRFVLERSCQTAAELRERYGVPLRISVNLSPRQFEQPGLLREVQAALLAANLEPSALTLEITESMVMEDLVRAQETMARLRDLGVGLAIDDFGTGHSSLSYLKQFPVQEVKVDRQFVAGISDHPVDVAIVKAVVDLARAMSITAVAEGIETTEQLELLGELSCPLAQGFLLSPPLPVPELERFLDRRFGRPAQPARQHRQPATRRRCPTISTAAVPAPGLGAVSN